MPRRPTRLAALLVLALAAGCTGSPATPTAHAPLASPGDPRSLRGLCPATVVVQDNWWPQAEYGPVYQLLGRDVRVDRAKKRVSGPLLDRGVDTGVQLEVRSGGPANGFTPSSKLLYSEPSVMFGSVDIDEGAAATRDQPVRAVFAMMDLSPVVLLWDPVQHPDFTTISDIGQTDVRVLYFPGSTYMDYLTGTGILRRSQVDASYDGSPARFVASRGSIVQQGYLTNEVYAYQNELPQWHRKIAWTLVADSGYPVYPETLAIRASRRDELAPCLRRLVPMLQRAAVDYLADPRQTNDLIVRLVRDFGGYPYSPARAANAVVAMRDNGIMGNGGNRTIGDFDVARVQRILDIVRPIFAAQRRQLPDRVGAVDLFTNEFLDPAIGVATK